MQTNYEIIEKVSIDCGITIEPCFITDEDIWKVMFIEAYTQEELGNFVKELFLNGITFKYEEGNIVIFETAI